MITWPQVGTGLLLLAGISGCVVGPNDRLPQVAVAATWSEGLPERTPSRRIGGRWHSRMSSVSGASAIS
jgi:hypothetical protein